MARTKDPSAATRKAWETRRRNQKAAGDYGPTVAAMPLSTPERIGDYLGLGVGLTRQQEEEARTAISRIEDQLDGHEIPEAAMDSLDSVGVVPQSFLDTAVKGAVGFYWGSTKVIQLSSKSAWAGDLAHEIGHHVHLAKLSDDALKEWAGISRNGQMAHISSYAKTNATEHFAEAFAAYSEPKRTIGSSLRKQLRYANREVFDFMERLFRTPSMWLPKGKSVFRNHLHPDVTGGFEAPKKPTPPKPLRG